MSARPERETSFVCDYDDMLDEEIVEAARDGEREAEAVSYTHLDVYKRQLLWIRETMLPSPSAAHR